MLTPSVRPGKRAEHFVLALAVRTPPTPQRRHDPASPRRMHDSLCRDTIPRMAKVRALVLRAPGINCDEETAFAWERAGATAERIHVNQLLSEATKLDAFSILTIPGGFSYGDDIASGRILGNQLRHHLGDHLQAFVDRGGLILGICNGFQVLVRMGLLPGDDCEATVTLVMNDSARYEDRWVRCRVETDHCRLLDTGEEFDFPVAHGEGKILIRGGSQGASELKQKGRLALTYISRDGSPAKFPENPNGSIENLAGLTDRTGRILGLMPHPERNLFKCQSPAKNRVFNTETAGSRFFRRIIERLV